MALLMTGSRAGVTVFLSTHSLDIAEELADRIGVVAQGRLIGCGSLETLRRSVTVRGATVAFTTATYGINTGGTVYRMDDVPIPLRPAFDSPYPSDETVLRALETGDIDVDEALRRVTPAL